MAKAKKKSLQDETKEEYDAIRKRVLSILQNMADGSGDFTKRLVQEAQKAIAMVETPTLPELPVVSEESRRLVDSFERATCALELDKEFGSSETETEKLATARHLALRDLLDHIRDLGG